MTESSDGETLMAVWFQIWGAVRAAEEKARRPTLVFVLGTCRRDCMARGMQRTTGLMVGYEVMKVSSGEDLVYVACGGPAYVTRCGLRRTPPGNQQ